ncbi:MAG: hypothetical protein P4L33_10645 [Capsulimonadaceae bacterium]|nr:hypothetical protein [Capsulimonadaceae bacterium]
MIFSAQPDVSEADFASLLLDTREATLRELKSGAVQAKTDGVQFENLVYRHASDVAKGTLFDGTIVQTGALTFPDIIARRYYGIEVKVTASDKWSSIGNSVLESTRVPGVERIYMYFGKLGGTPDIKFRPYQECLSEVGVTHSPRYMIDMNLPEGGSIFDKIGVPYDELRKEKNSIGLIKDYYRSQLADGEELWWIDAKSEETAPSPIIKPFSSFATEERQDFIIETMALFPEIFGQSNLKFERVAAYLVASRNAVCSNVRDVFTAGGQKAVTIGDRQVLVPQIFFKLNEVAPQIATYLAAAEPDHLRSYWKTIGNDGDIAREWKALLDRHSFSQLHRLNITASSVFEAGLQCD